MKWHKLKRLFTEFLIVLMVVAQPSAVVLADEAPADSTQTTQASPSPSPSPDPSPSPSPSPDPSPSPSPDPSPSPSPSPSASPSPSPSPAPQQDTRGPSGPTGPQQPTSHAPDYAFNDATHKWEPTIISSFSWTGSAWVSPFYYQDSIGWYHVRPGITPSDSIAALTAGSGDPAATLASILGLNDPSNSNTGPGSNNLASHDANAALLATLYNNLGITNNSSQNSLSGDASVNGNTSAGDATSGAASVVSNLLNLLNAMWSFASGNLAYFVQNITGDHNGDISINPPTASTAGGQLGGCSGGVATNTNTGPNSDNTATNKCSADLNVNSKTKGTITNNIDANATSGNASVSGNTLGGNATSGDASAEINIINLINTAIGAGQSFFGMINIYGNLNGDILFPSLNLNGAVGSNASGGANVSNSNTGPNSNNTAGSTNSNSATVNNNVSGAFNNNVNAKATSGNAAVSDNTSAGSATSGDASTNTSLFNLFNTSVFGSNAVLVIINDMGHWVGRIMNLGVADTSGGGLLTSDATVQNGNTGPGSSNTASNSNSNSATVNNQVNGSITNNVNANATSGNATVSDNTKAGNATSGNAKVATNIANIMSSSLNFTHIFGILFINVFGTWNGSVGIDTAAGNAPVSLSQVLPGSGSGGASQTDGSTGGSLSASGNGSSGLAGVAQLLGGGNSGKVLSHANPVTVVLAAAKVNPQAAAKAATQATSYLLVLTAVSLLLAAAGFTLERRLRLNR